jgi:hypothetical protein
MPRGRSPPPGCEFHPMLELREAVPDCATESAPRRPDAAESPGLERPHGNTGQCGQVALAHEARAHFGAGRFLNFHFLKLKRNLQTYVRSVRRRARSRLALRVPALP